MYLITDRENGIRLNLDHSIKIIDLNDNTVECHMRDGSVYHIDKNAITGLMNKCTTKFQGTITEITPSP